MLQHIATAGKLKALDDEWIQVTFEAPQLQIGGLEFSYGGQSEVKLQIIYIDEKIRLGKGSRGSLFVFQRRWGHVQCVNRMNSCFEIGFLSF